MQWLFIAIAAVMETCWTYCLRYLHFKKFGMLTWANFFIPEGLAIWLPLLGYVAFGIGNVYFFSLALKTIPTATAFAIWTTVSIIFIKIAELVVTKTRISLPELFFLAVTIIGIAGLKAYSQQIVTE